MKFSNSIMKIKRKVINQYIAVFIVGLPYLSIGTSLYWLNIAVTKLRTSGDEPQMSNDDSIVLVTWAIVGLLISSATNIFAQDRKGRKFFLVFGQIFLVAGWMILICTSSHAFWCLGRTLEGFSSGFVLSSGYVYVAEISEDHSRGIMECTVILMFNFGNILLFAMNPFVSLQTLTICCLIFSFVSMLLVLFLPESPYYLISKEKPIQAESALMVLRGKEKPSDIADEMKKIKNTVAEDRANRGTIRDLFVARRNVKPFALSSILIVICYLHGYGVIGSCVTVIFSETGSSMDENMVGLILSSSQLVISLIASPFTDKVGRRPILMTSFSGSTLGLSSLALHFYLKEYTTLKLNWLPLTSLVIYYMSYSLGIGLVPWTVVSELLPLRIRAPGVAVLCVISAVSSYACVEIYRNCHAFGNHVIFLTYAFVCLLGLLFVGFILPETKQMSFIEIDRAINCTKSEKDVTSKENSTHI